MLFAGIDLGSTTGKVAVMEIEGDTATLRASSIMPSGFAPDELAGALLGAAAVQCGAEGLGSFAGICATGYGRESVSSITHNVSEISCHAKGAAWALPGVRTIIDVGGQDVKVISLAEDGSMIDFCMNDKCAAGTGRFFEAMARILQCGIEELSDMALAAEEAVLISSTCSVFAESEVVALINRQVPRESIARGIQDSIAERVFGMTQRVGLVPQVVFTGGCAKSAGLRRALEERCGLALAKPEVDPQIMGAIGAALFARDRFVKRAAK